MILNFDVNKQQKFIYTTKITKLAKFESNIFWNMENVVPKTQEIYRPLYGNSVQKSNIYKMRKLSSQF